MFAERDTNNEVLWVWSYPGVDGGLRDLLMKKCNLDQEDQEEEGKETAVLQFSFGHYSQVWYYLSNFQAAQSETLPKVFSLLWLTRSGATLTVNITYVCIYL